MVAGIGVFGCGYKMAGPAVPGSRPRTAEGETALRSFPPHPCARPTPGPAPLAVIVMGVSGSGKSTLGTMIAAATGRPFLEGDSYHAADAVAKMRSGTPLTDADRWPWLDRLATAIDAAARRDGFVVAACSALKRSYRDRLLNGIGVPVRFVLLRTDREALAGRVAGRPGHYMPASLLDSQLATLEPPGADEPAIILDGGETPDRLCGQVFAWLDGAVPPLP